MESEGKSLDRLYIVCFKVPGLLPLTRSVRGIVIALVKVQGYRLLLYLVRLKLDWAGMGSCMGGWDCQKSRIGRLLNWNTQWA